MEQFSSAYGWTPNQIRKLGDEDYKAYLSILKGKGQAEKK